MAINIKISFLLRGKSFYGPDEAPVECDECANNDITFKCSPHHHATNIPFPNSSLNHFRW